MKTPYLLLPVLLLTACASTTKGPVVADQPPAPVYSAPVSQPTADELVLSKETLQAGKVVVPNGYVGLKKVVTTHQASQAVDLNVEGYEIVHVAPTTQTPDFTEKEIGLNLTRENATANVSSQVVDVVRLNRVNTSEKGQVQASLRTESVVRK